MAGEEPSRALTLSEQRDRTIQTLIDHFTEDHLTMEELERRLDVAARALRTTDLDVLTADLPAPAAPAPAAAPAAVNTPAVRQHTAPAPSDRENQVLVAIMGGVVKKGRWTPARRTYVIAFMGGAELDFRDAILPAGVTDIQIFTIWGGIEIVVPPGIRIDSSGVAIMGGFDHVPGPTVEDPDAPTIRINGLALMAGVEIHVRLPGETARDAQERRRAERKKLREERKRLS